MIDLLEDEDGDLKWDGDVHWGESTEQHIQDILLACPGEFEQAPVATVGLRQFLEDERPEDMAADVRRKITRDGMIIEKITATNTNIDVNAYYPNA